MRDIEFRGKRKDTGKWIIGFLTNYYEYFASIRLPTRMKEYHVEPETVGQYSGLSDCNGKRIYEGDIVKTEYAGTEHIGAVGISEYEVTVDFKDTMGEVSIKNILSLFCKIEVIGNVYETPGFLGWE